MMEGLSQRVTSRGVPAPHAVLPTSPPEPHPLSALLQPHEWKAGDPKSMKPPKSVDVAPKARVSVS